MLKTTAGLLASSLVPVILGLLGTFIAGTSGTWLGLLGGVILVFVSIAFMAGR